MEASVVVNDLEGDPVEYPPTYSLEQAAREYVAGGEWHGAPLITVYAWYLYQDGSRSISEEFEVPIAP